MKKKPLENAKEEKKKLYIKPEMVLIPGGILKRKYTEKKSIEEKNKNFFLRLLGKKIEKIINISYTVEVHLATFYMSKYPVTNEEYKLFKPAHKGRWLELDCPVETVSWYDAVGYCNWLSDRDDLERCYTGSGEKIVVDISRKGYRLPSEAEWEYACKAGTTTDYYWGDYMDGNYCWYCDNSGNRVQPAGKKKPNAFGLHDMSGNLWEWCLDWYDSDYYSKGPLKNPTGPDSASCRVRRGGSYCDFAIRCRSARRGYDFPGHRRDALGFRIVSKIYRSMRL